MKRLFYLLIGLVLLPALLYAQGTLSLKQINDDLHTNYSTSATIAADYATTASVALKADKTYVNATDESIIASVALKATQVDMDSAEAAINVLNIDNDSQDVQIESNRVAITLKADSDEIHTDISQAYVNVKEFGAVGDGITDDATAINNAIASLTSGGVVLFPSGYYCIKSQITLTSKHGLTLRGVGHGKDTTYLGTNIYATGYNGHHFRGIDCVGVSIENMNLTAEGQDSSFAVGGIYFSISSNSNNPYHTFKDLFISDISNSGISIGTPIMTNFNNVTVRKCVGSSFNVWSGTSTTWTNCYANNATEAGWLLTGMTYCTLQGCAAESAGVGYYFDNSKSISVMGCGTEAIINRGGAFNGYAYRSINGSNAITLYDCYDRISETGTFSESAGGILDYINHKTDSNAQITKIHSLPASTSTYTDTYTLGATNLQTALDTVAVWLNNIDIELDSIEAAIQGIIIGSGFATEDWVNSTLETNFYNADQTDATIEAAIAAIPAVDTNQTVTVTAGEALTAGQVVSLINKSGSIKAYNTPLTVSTSPNGAESVFNSAATTYCSAVCLDSTRFLVAYRDSDNYPKAIVGTVSGSTISWGAEANIESTNSLHYSVCKIATDKVLMAYGYFASSATRVVVLSISTSTITVNTPVDVDTNTTCQYTSLSTLETDKAILCYQGPGTGTSNARIITVSSTTPTPYPAKASAGTEFNVGATFFISCSALSSTSAIVAYQDVGNSNYGTAQVLSISGTTITPGTEYVFRSATTTAISTAALTSTTALITCNNLAYVATNSSGTLSYGASTTITANGCSNMASSAIDATHVLIAFQDGTTTTGKSGIITINGTGSSMGSLYEFNAAGTTYPATCYLGSQKSAIAYVDGGNSSYGTAVVNTWATTSYASVSGISQGAYSSGSDAVVLISGSYDGLSSLIPGSPYFVNSSFELQTTPVSLTSTIYSNAATTREIHFGVAKSSTEILLDIDYR